MNARRPRPEHAPEPCAGGGSCRSAARGTRTRSAGARAGPPGTRSISAPVGARVGAVAARHEPVARALEDRDVGRLLRDLREELDRAGARADDGHPLARAGRSRGPTRRSGRLWPSKLPGNRGVAGWWSCPVARITASAVRSPFDGRDGPAARRVVPAAGADLRAGLDQPVDAVVAGDLVQVAQDVRLRSGTGAPSRGAGRRRTSRSGSGRRMPRPGRCCAATCRRGPGALSRIATSVDAVAAQLDGRGDAAEAGADDHDLRHARHPRARLRRKLSRQTSSWVVRRSISAAGSVSTSRAGACVAVARTASSSRSSPMSIDSVRRSTSPSV